MKLNILVCGVKTRFDHGIVLQWVLKRSPVAGSHSSRALVALKHRAISVCHYSCYDLVRGKAASAWVSLTKAADRAAR